LRHNIVRVEDGEGRTYVQNEYNPDPASWSYTRVSRQLNGDYLFQYRYTQLQYVPPSGLLVNIPAVRTEVMAPDGGVTTYTFNYRGDVLDHRRRLSRDRSWRVVVWAYDYDDQGNVTTIRWPDGGEDLRVYDNGNADPRLRGTLLRRELRARSGFPSPSRIVWRGTYEPTYQLLRSEISETGNETRYRYDFDISPGPGTTGNLREIIHPTTTLPDGTSQTAVTKFETNGRGQVTAVISPLGIRNELEYFNAGPEKGFLELRRNDAGGAALEERYSYDAFGYMESITDGAGGVRRLVHNAMGQIERRTVPDVGGEVGEVITHFDTDGNAISIERPRGSYTDSVISGLGIVDDFQRDVLGHVTDLDYGTNTERPRRMSICIDFRGFPVVITDPMGTVTKTFYDERSHLLREQTEGEARTILAFRRRVYDLAGRIERLIEGPAEDRQTRYEYDAFGRLHRTFLPNGSVRTFTWGRRDLLEQETLEGDAGDGTTRVLASKRYVHDERARLVKVIESSFRTDPTTVIDLEYSFFYTADNKLERVVDPRGGERTFAYDGLGRLTSITDPEGNIEHRSYDTTQRETRTEFHDQEPTGVAVRIWTTQYDPRSRPSKIVDPNGTALEIRYDDRDLPTTLIEPQGVERHRTFGQLGELLSDSLDPGGLNIVNRWEYNLRNEPVQYIDPMNEITHYTYDSLGRLTAVTLPGGFGTKRVYDASGRVTRERLPSGVEIVFGCDSAGRLTSIESAGAAGVSALPAHTFVYDGMDRVASASNGPATLNLVFDSQSRLVRETSNGTSLELFFDDLAGTLERRWPDGRREVITTNLNGVPTRIERTAAGSLGSGPALLGTFTPSGPANLGNAHLLGGVDVGIVYDRRKRTVQITYQKSGAVLEQVDYRYDSRNRRRISALSGTPAQVRYCEFDTRDRLVRAAEDFSALALGPSETQVQHDADISNFASAAASAPLDRGFAYDSSDARTVYSETGNPDRLYNYLAGHRLNTAGAENFSHHVDGPREADGSRQYEIDALGRITAIKGSGGNLLAQLGYDPLGRPSQIDLTSGHSYARAYFGDELWQENHNGALFRQFTPHPFLRGPLAASVASETYLTLVDTNASLLTMLDSRGCVAERFRYAPFGWPSIFAPDGTPRSASAIDQEPTFGGMPFVDDTSLYVARRRLMDPVHGVFLNVDPLGYTGGPNLYAYAAQNPIDFADPDGEFAILGVLAVMAIGAAIAGGLNAARQGIQLAEGSHPTGEFSWGDVALSSGIGAVLAPVFVVAPELAIPLAAYGVGSGVGEIAEGNYATGTFDIVASLAPFGFKGPRNATFGSGSRIGQWRGLGESASWSTRFGRFSEVGNSTRLAFRNLRYRRFYRGTTTEDTVAIENTGRLDVDLVIGRQNAPESLGNTRGPGLYLTEELFPEVPGSSIHWARVHSVRNPAYEPAVVEASIPRLRFWLRAHRPDSGIVAGARQGKMTHPRSILETFIPEEQAPWFNQAATWRVVPWPVEPPPTPNFSPLWPTLHTLPYRPPDRAHALEPSESIGDTPQGEPIEPAGGKLK
jgi:RHS repeat-associated protein